MVVQEPITEYAKSKNLLIQELLNEPDDLKVIGKVLWCRAGTIVIEEIKRCVQQIVIKCTYHPTRGP